MRASFPVPLVCPLVLLSIAATGCRFGEAHFNSTMPGRNFDPSGTVFAYTDAHDDQLLEELNPRVVIAMTWIIFDPNGDLNDLEGSALEDYSHELKLRDAVSLVFDQQGDLGAGASFVENFDASTGDSDNEGPQMSAVVHLAPERLSASTTYAEFVPLASKRRVNVVIDGADFTAASPVVAGEATVTFERADGDPGDARTGTFSGTFRAPLVNERTAEENLGLLDVEEVLGLPLGPRIEVHP